MNTRTDTESTMKKLALYASVLLLALGAWTYQAQPVGVVLKVDGSVQLEPEGGSAQAAAVGARLSAGDRLVPGSGGSALIILRGGERVEVGEAYTVPEPSGSSDGGDMFGRTVQVLGQVASANTDNLADRQGMIRPIPGEPVLVAPRNDLKVMNRRPTFTWYAVEGVEGYTIQVRTPGSAPKRFRTADTVWTYPDDAEALERGTEYWWTVAPEGSGRATREQRFTVIGADAYERVTREIRALAEDGLDPSSDGAFLAAALYRHAGLYYEAARALAALESSGAPMGRNAWLLKGEILAALGDVDGARTAFDRADSLGP